jgi:hypothetical protein
MKQTQDSLFGCALTFHASEPWLNMIPYVKWFWLCTNRWSDEIGRVRILFSDIYEKNGLARPACTRDGLHVVIRVIGIGNKEYEHPGNPVPTPFPLRKQTCKHYEDHQRGKKRENLSCISNCALIVAVLVVMRWRATWRWLRLLVEWTNVMEKMSSSCKPRPLLFQLLSPIWRDKH